LSLLFLQTYLLKSCSSYIRYDIHITNDCNSSCRKFTRRIRSPSPSSDDTIILQSPSTSRLPPPPQITLDCPPLLRQNAMKSNYQFPLDTIRNDSSSSQTAGSSPQATLITPQTSRQDTHSQASVSHTTTAESHKSSDHTSRHMTFDRHAATPTSFSRSSHSAHSSHEAAPSDHKSSDHTSRHMTFYRHAATLLIPHMKLLLLSHHFLTNC